jgi:iron(III) transport system ATP-binding protein
MTLLTVSNISKQGLGDFKLEDISFTQGDNEKIAIAGETGSGKSTLLKIIAGLLQPDTGEVLLDEENVRGPAKNLVPGHARIAYLTQDHELPKFLRVEQVLQYANNIAPEQAANLFHLCEIDHLLTRRTDELSGGERQRIALAKLLITSPKLLLLDEPFSSLDMAHKMTLKNVLRRVCRQLQITCILVSHDPSDILAWAHQIIVLRNGKVVQEGSPRRIYNKPVDEYAAGLFGAYNLLPEKLITQLYKQWQAKPPHTHLIVRPENLKFTNNKKRSICGLVVDIGFFGSYHEIEVEVDRVKMIVRSKRKRVKLGQKVYITCSRKHVHAF